MFQRKPNQVFISCTYFLFSCGTVWSYLKVLATALLLTLYHLIFRYSLLLIGFTNYILVRSYGFHICVFMHLGPHQKRCLKRHVCWFIQRLRCRCNFHALRFLPNLQDLGLLIAQRMRENHPRWGPIDDDFNTNENSNLAGIFPIKYSLRRCDSNLFLWFIWWMVYHMRSPSWMDVHP